jgi:hypothetical protein
MKDLVIEMTATLPAPPDSVLARVIDVVRDAGGGRIEVDHDRRLVAVQGGWWYCGEYQVDPTDNGTQLTHRVRNIASRARWAVPLANRLFIGYRAKTKQNFAAFVANLT